AGNLLSGESWADAFSALKPFKPEAILVNCVPPEIARKALEKLKIALDGYLSYGAYANGFGHAGSEQGWDFSNGHEDAANYAHACDEWSDLGATFIGGCCGTTPQYTEAYAHKTAH